ncbi:MAG: hypothetical protein K2Q09_09895 [Phycisphaerales bacterium]|nr:hypothetical protein [Phycisphaerales bacterium]
MSTDEKTEIALTSKFHDPLLAPTEQLVKAEMDVEHYTEAQRRAKAAEENELTAPLVERTGPLPERLTTLKYLTPEDQRLYARDADGSFVLAFLKASDHVSVMHYTDRIGRSIHLLREGETPETQRAREQRNKEMEKRVHDILAEDERKKRQAEMEAFEAEERKRRAEFERQREEHYRRYSA